MCEIRVPFEIKVINDILNETEGKVISAGLVVAIVSVMIFLMVLAILVLRGKEGKIKNLIGKLEMAKKKGYRNKPKPI